MPETIYSAERLAPALASRLAEVVPPGHRITRDGLTIYIHHPPGARTIPGWQLPCESLVGLNDPAEYDLRELVSDALRVLDQIQDCICEETTEKWPPSPEPGFPDPYVEVDGDDLRLGWRLREVVDVPLRPIPLGELRLPGGVT